VGGEQDPVLEFPSAAAWEEWLARAHDGASGVWLKIPKKGAGPDCISYGEALDLALCYGWIDGQKRGLDERQWLQRFTPRTARSPWSKLNRERALRLIERGVMKPPGLREVERAKADGRWDAAYDSQSTARVPPDLAEALAGDPQAQAFFATLNGVNRYAILHRVQTARRPETRARRIERFVAMLRRGERPYP
jgi:uncharacterized protein YdeI (YjbR/CyaY-like superfamily)